MTLSEVRRRCRNSAWIGSLLALILVAAALGVRFAAGDVLRSFPYMTFFPAVAVATYLGDRRAGWVATAASLALVWDVFLRRAGLDLMPPSGLVSLPVFLVIAGIVVEVTAFMNRSSDAALRMANENRMLFLELKHRTANDLQMVASLLSLHQAEATDEHSRRLVGDAIARLRLLGDLHRQTYEPGSSSLDMGRFLSRLCADLGASLARSPISCDVRADYVMSADATVPLTMIVHELVSNAIEHGAGARSDGHVMVGFAKTAVGAHVLTVEDDGPGIPAGFDPKQSKRLGMKLVRAFSAQIGVTLDWSPRSGGGTLATLTFPPAESGNLAPERSAVRKGGARGIPEFL